MLGRRAQSVTSSCVCEWDLIFGAIDSFYARVLASVLPPVVLLDCLACFCSFVSVVVCCREEAGVIFESLD
jgi:hypothetical protein